MEAIALVLRSVGLGVGYCKLLLAWMLRTFSIHVIVSVCVCVSVVMLSFASYSEPVSLYENCHPQTQLWSPQNSKTAKPIWVSFFEPKSTTQLCHMTLCVIVSETVFGIIFWFKFVSCFLSLCVRTMIW